MESFQKYLELVLPKTEFNQLSAYLIEKKIKKGEIILNAGSICNHSFFVEEGLLRSYSIDEQGKEHIIQFAPENWMISDRSSLLFQEPSEFYIDAVENTILIMF
jgi:CRP-like cAMP-binding protein